MAWLWHPIHVTAALAIGSTAIVLITTFVVLMVLRCRAQMSPLKHLAHPPLSGVIGASDFLATVTACHRTLLKWANQYGGLYWMRVFHKVFVIVTDPRLANQVLSGKYDCFSKTPGVYAPLTMASSSKGVSNMLSLPTNEHWKLIRRAIAAAFSTKNVRKAFPVVCGYTQHIVDELMRLGPHTPVDMDRLLILANLQVIVHWGYNRAVDVQGGDCKAAEVLGHYFVLLPEIQHIIQSPVRKFAFWDKDHRAAMRSRDWLDSFYEQLLAGVVASGCVDDPQDQCLGSQLLRIRDEAGRPLSREELKSHVGILFTAGFDTSGHTTFWTLWLLSGHPQALSHVETELDGAGLLASPANPTPREITVDDLPKLKYLDACIKESMRLMPVAAFGSAREVTAPVRLGDVELRRGVAILVPYFAAFRSRHNWEDPDSFKPERWLEGQGVEYADAAPDAEDGSAEGGPRVRRFFPFSEGVRDCVGQPLARMAVPTYLAILLARFTFKRCREVAPEELEELVVTLKPTAAARLLALPRTITPA